MRINFRELIKKVNAIVWIYTLVVAGFLVGAGVLALQAFSTAAGTGTAAANAIDAFITALSNFSTQAATVGTMVGIGLLIAVVFGALAYFAIGRMNK